MATASGEYPRQLNCQVCEEEYTLSGDKVPRLLLCGHSLCHDCLSRLPVENNNTMLCPFDRQPTPLGSAGVTALKKNFALLELLESLQEASRNQPSIVSGNSIEIEAREERNPVDQQQPTLIKNETKEDALMLELLEKLQKLSSNKPSLISNKVIVKNKQALFVASSSIPTSIPSSFSIPNSIPSSFSIPTSFPVPKTYKYQFEQSTTSYPLASDRQQTTNDYFGSQAKVLFDYEASNADELSVRADEVLTVINTDAEEGWWEGQNSRGQTGLFPATFVEIISKLYPLIPPSLPVDEYHDAPQLTQCHSQNCFALAEEKCTIQPDFIWKISGIQDKMKEGWTFELSSDVFKWANYPVYCYAKMIVTHYDRVYLSLCLEDLNLGLQRDIKPIPAVYYVLQDQSGKGSEVKHFVRVVNYLHTEVFHYALTFNSPICLKSILADPLYNVNDSIAIKIYVESPSAATMAHSYDGTLDWVIGNYRGKKRMTREYLVGYDESPYFYTAPRGYRVLVKMFLDGYGEHRGKGVTAEISFKNGEFDADLPLTFPHKTTVTFVSHKNSLNNITKVVTRFIPKEKYYFIHMGNNDEIENVVENDAIFYTVTIEEF